MNRKLAFDPTPASFTTALRKRYPGFWERIHTRRFVILNYVCDICGSDRERRDRLDAHEVYSFPSPGLVKLEKVIFVCKTCHEAIHLERTRRFASKQWRQTVENHYCAVNGVTPDDLAQDFRFMMLQSRELRSTYGASKPRMDYGNYQAEADLCETRKRPASESEDDSDFEEFPDHECPWDIGHAN